jgi:hypothetical protein
MITRAGYIRQNGFAAIDDDGVPNEIAELYIHGTKYAIRIDELNSALEGRYPARIERVFQNWQQYLGGVSGLASVSRSGNALNIEIVTGGRYTISLDAVRSMLYRRGSYATVGEIPEPLGVMTGTGRRLASGQQTIPVSAV